MDYTVKVAVTIECENCDFRTTIEIVEMIFTSYETIFDLDVTKDKFEKALKYIKNDFKVLTIQCYSHKSNDYCLANDYILGRRYTNNFGDIKRAASNGSYFNHWHEVDTKNLKKQLFEDLKECINIANRHFISLVKTEK
jgi:hypothetical protein